jgi:ATP-dependent DNA ligase
MLRTASRPILIRALHPQPEPIGPPSGSGWVHEIKHDGYRLVARRDGAGVRLITRNGHDWSDRYYPTVAGAVGRLRCSNASSTAEW